jgi:hypothetical protein
MIDPISAMAAISAALGLVDKFVGLVRDIRGKDQRPYSVQAKQKDDKFIVEKNGSVVETVKSDQLHLNQWDEPRFKALQQRVALLWGQFNGIYAQLPIVSIDERIRLEQRMEQMRQELCKDFRDMVRISEATLGVALDDHYTLYDTCSNIP